MGEVMKMLPDQEPLRCYGAHRAADNKQALSFVFSRKPTDDELRFLHEVMKRAAVNAPK